LAATSTASGSKAVFERPIGQPVLYEKRFWSIAMPLRVSLYEAKARVSFRADKAARALE
jgi:uncharacterized protein (DUF302 family)